MSDTTVNMTAGNAVATNGLRLIAPGDPAIRTMGRIDDADPAKQIWVFPYTQAAFRFTGTKLGVRVINRWNYGDSHFGVIIDGVPSKVRVAVNDTAIDVTLAENLPDMEHEAIIYKRQDGQHYFEIFGFLIENGAQIMPTTTPEPQRRIEVFGDSVSCGERNEALLYAGKADPEVDLSSYSNSWYAYDAITARNLGAALHDVSQGGASLLDGIGWFNAPSYVGMESIWDRIQYNPTLGESKPWDFSRYTPHVAIVAIGQNDAHPDDFMKDDYDGEQARHWRSRYVDFIKALRAKYPKAQIILTTTVLQHDPSWDKAIDEACKAANDPKVTHFLYTRNGAATPGHPRISEHEEMASELTAYIESLGDDIWQD